MRIVFMQADLPMAVSLLRYVAPPDAHGSLVAKRPPDATPIN